jgi:hypothetical protein
MSEKRYVVPDGMRAAYKEAGGFLAGLEAAMRWLAENPIVPTEEQILLDAVPSLGSARRDIQHHIAAWQRRMFLSPEPEIPEAVKGLMFSSGNGEADRRMIEAYKRGFEAGRRPENNKMAALE